MAGCLRQCYSAAVSAEPIASETIEPAPRVRGAVTVPGDKSVSHRYALIAAIADGTTSIENYAPGADCASTLSCLQRLGVQVIRPGPSIIHIEGRGLRGLQAPGDALDAGNSGSTMRMLAGVVAAHEFSTTLTGDSSLRRRPMRRVATPLEAMGARIDSADGRPPLTVHGARLRGIAFSPEIPSAQVKSAVLLAGLQANGTTVVREPASTRDHTELALGAFGVSVRRDGLTTSLAGDQHPIGRHLLVPGDISSATFWAVAAAALPGSEIEIGAVGLNPTRSAILGVLGRAGAQVDAVTEAGFGGEPVGRVRVRHRVLEPFTIAPSEVPGLIDELPALAALGALGAGMSVTGASELRHKESDRIHALVVGLRALGAEARELADGFVVQGSRPLAGGRADGCGDHRLAMAFSIAALGAREPSAVAGADAVDVSYPGFFEVLRSICA
jgi:3-phosphoshikimate 1-carboxyvinyltransferase